MPRYRLTIEYDGTPFVGWQIQPDGPSVQGAITQAVRCFCGETVDVRGAGRTDAGVHALGQVAHIDLIREFPAATVRNAINFHLKPNAIAILAAQAVPDTFDARFSATKRHYVYRILNRRAPPSSTATESGGSRDHSTSHSWPTLLPPWSAGTTSRPSAPSAVRPNRR